MVIMLTATALIRLNKATKIHSEEKAAAAPAPIKSGKFINLFASNAKITCTMQARIRVKITVFRPFL